MHTETFGRRPSSSGVHCNFIRMDSGWGLKLYWVEETARHTYNMQRFAAEHSLAPKVGSCVFRFMRDGEEMWGYYTECIDCTVSNKLHHTYGDNWWKKWPRDEVTNSLIFDEIGLPDIKQDLLDIGMEVYDLHYCNVGYMPDGRLVCIDFDQAMIVCEMK